MTPYFILWKWTQANFRTRYTMEHVNSMVWQLTNQGVPLDHIILVTDEPEGADCPTFPLWRDYCDMNNVSGRHLPSCYRRLRIFDPGTQEAMGIPPGSRVCSLDLDSVILQKFLMLFERDEEFVGWYVPGSRHRIVLNGSMFMFTAGQLGWIWDQFDPKRSPMMALSSGYMGSDQGYLSHCVLGTGRRGKEKIIAGGWNAADHGVLSYTRDVRQMRVLPRHARVVFFAGKKKPWDAITRRESPWIARYVAPQAQQEKVA